MVKSARPCVIDRRSVAYPNISDKGTIARMICVEPRISASRGRVEIASARPLVPLNGWRAMFDLVPTDASTEPINLRLFLALDGQALTETWLYEYTPPPADHRQY